MAYVTSKEIVDRYGLDYLVIVSDHNEDGLSDLTPVDLAIDDASAEIDKFMSTRFVVPVANVDTDASLSWIKRCCTDLAVYFLASTAGTMTEIIQQRRDDCMEELMRIADGTINPGGAVAPMASGNKLSANVRQNTRSNLCLII